jgi:hypothetical protein
MMEVVDGDKHLREWFQGQIRCQSTAILAAQEAGESYLVGVRSIVLHTYLARTDAFYSYLRFV